MGAKMPTPCPSGPKPRPSPPPPPSKLSVERFSKGDWAMTVGDAICMNDNRFYEVNGLKNPLRGNGPLGGSGIEPSSTVEQSCKQEFQGDPRLIHGPQFGRPGPGAFAAFGFAALMLVAAAAGFVLGKVL